MKKHLSRFVVLLTLLTLWPQLFAATVANELYLTKRNSANTANQQVAIQSDTGKFLRADGTAQTISGALDLISSTQGTILYRNASGWVAIPPGTSGQLFSTQGAAANPIWVTATGGAGDMNGPASATDNAIVRFDGTGGKTGQNSAVTIADTTGAMTWATGQSATLTGGDSGASLVLGQGTTAGVTVAAGATGGTATAVNTGGLRSANFGLSTVSGGPSYFGGNLSVSTSSNDGGIVMTGSGVGGPFIVADATNATVANRFAGLALKSGGVAQWSVGIRAGDGALHFADTVTSRAVIRATGDITFTPQANVNISAGALTIASTTASIGLGTGALQVAGGIYAGAASYFGGEVTIGGTLTLPAAPAAANRYILTGVDNSGTGQLTIQAGGGSPSWGGTMNLFETAHATKGGWVGVGLGVSGAKFTINSTGFSNSGEVASIDRAGNATFAGTVTAASLATAQTPSASVATASTHKVPIVLNGTTYYMLLTNVP